jgi:hypothetical protein
MIENLEIRNAILAEINNDNTFTDVQRIKIDTLIGKVLNKYNICKKKQMK